MSEQDTVTEMLRELERLKKERMREEIHAEEADLQVEAAFRVHVTDVVDGNKDLLREAIALIEKFTDSHIKIVDQMAQAVSDLGKLKESIGVSVKDLKDTKEKVQASLAFKTKISEQMTKMDNFMGGFNTKYDTMLKIKEDETPRWVRIVGWEGVAVLVALGYGMFTAWWIMSRLSECLPLLIDTLQKMRPLLEEFLKKAG